MHGLARSLGRDVKRVHDDVTGLIDRGNFASEEEITAVLNKFGQA